MSEFIEASSAFFALNVGRRGTKNKLDTVIKFCRSMKRISDNIRDYWGFRTW